MNYPQDPPDSVGTPELTTVLCVDDTPDVLESLATLLTLWGFAVLVARDGAEALQLATQHKPSVIVSDLGMPNVNGFDLARAIRRHEWGVDILMIAQSGWTSQETKLNACNAGFDYCLSKPVGFGELRRLLTRSSAT